MNSGIAIKDCFKHYSHDQDKAKNPKETVAWVKDRLDRSNINILSKTMRIDNGRLDIPVYISLCGEDATRLTNTKKQMGKGATPAQSEASAVMELMERFSFFSFIHETLFPLIPYGKVGSEAISVDLLLRSLQDRTSQPERCAAFLRDLPMRWTVAHDFTGRRDIRIPIDWFYLINEYNGPAAGNTIEEAILQSLCEVVERHVGSVICHDRLTTPAIDPASLKDPAAIELVEKFRRQGIELFMRDFSLDTGIPSVGALAYDPKTFPHSSEIVFTVGTTSDPEKSLCRALTEIAQLAGDFENRTSYRPTLPKYENLEEARYLMGTDNPIAIDQLPNLADNNLRVEIERCVRALAEIDLPVLVLDATHSELQVPVVYTIVPGAHFLEHTRNTDFPQHAARTLLHSLPPGEARCQLERLRESFGPRYDLTFFHAHSLELQGEVRAALALFEESLNLDPEPREVASIHVHRASCLKDLEEYEKALEALGRAETHNEELKEIYNLRGFCHYRLKQHHEAIKAFERAIELDPGSAIDYANIGSNLRELGHKKEALRLYKMALNMDPSIDFARANVEKLERELGSEPSAE